MTQLATEDSAELGPVQVHGRDRQAGHPALVRLAGFGDSVRRQISPDQAAELQEHLVRFLGNGTGAATSVSTALAAVLILANSLARGHSAVRIELIEHLVAMLNSDIVPVIPEKVQSARAATWCRCPMSPRP